MASPGEVDILMPTYNRRAFLPHALASIRGQSFRNWRLLVVNDGGEDVSDLVAACRDDRIVYFDRPHLGKAAQLNFALRQTDAPFVAYMDDDDEVFPDHLEKLVGAARRYDADFVYSDTFYTVKDCDGRICERKVECGLDAPYETLRIRNRINHKQILHSRALAEEVGDYDERMRILIDFDYIKRLAKAARRPYHLREVTGDHILRKDPKTGVYSSISGLWERDPVEAGRSLLAFFEKDPEALKMLYRRHMELSCEVEDLRRRVDRLRTTWWDRLASAFKRRLPDGCFHEDLQHPVPWRDVTPSGGLLGFFALADETAPEIARVNDIAAGRNRKANRRKMRRPMQFPFESEVPAFSVERSGGAVRFRHPGGRPMRWVMLSSRQPLPEDFALSFTYTPYTFFTEQLQFDFRMSSLGDRLRLMVRENARAVVSEVVDGRFRPDLKAVPFSFAPGVPARVRLSCLEGVMTLEVDGRLLISGRYEGSAGRRAGFAALVFYEASDSRAIDFELSDFRFWIPQ